MGSGVGSYRVVSLVVWNITDVVAVVLDISEVVAGVIYSVRGCNAGGEGHYRGGGGGGGIVIYRRVSGCGGDSYRRGSGGGG
jgi:hypothetical protein